MLIERIRYNSLTHEEYFLSRDVLAGEYQGCSELDAACNLLVNRLAYSGICKANPLGGKGGSLKNLLARWNLEDLILRIKKVHSLSERIEVFNMNAVNL